MTPSQQFPTAISIFGPDWRQARKTDLDRHLRQHYSRRSLAVLNRALNALTRHHGSFQATRYITLGTLADLAAREAAGQIHIGYYGPAARIAATHFFSDDLRFQTSDHAQLPAALTLGRLPTHPRLPAHPRTRCRDG